MRKIYYFVITFSFMVLVLFYGLSGRLFISDKITYESRDYETNTEKKITICDYRYVLLFKQIAEESVWIDGVLTHTNKWDTGFQICGFMTKRLLIVDKTVQVQTWQEAYRDAIARISKIF